MSQPTFAGVRRRNPRRATTRETRSRNPDGRVTRSAARLLSASSDSSDSSDSDEDVDGSSADELHFTPPRRTLRNQGRRSERIETAALTRDRHRHDAGPRGRTLVGEGSSRRIRAIAATTSRGHGRQSNPSPTKTPSKKKANLGFKIGSAKKSSHASNNQPNLSSSKVIPPWQRLEWTLLVQIFEYASYPLNTRANVRWLLLAGLTCKAFLGPALKALYKCPPPMPLSMNMANKFAALIRDLAAHSAAALAREDHRRTMIESLVINVSSISHSQTRNFDIAEFILSLSSLAHVELYHDFDLPPYRQLDVKAKKWTYSPELLRALRSAGDSESTVRLKSWKWSQRMMDRDNLPPEDLKTIHQCTTFSQLRKVSFVNFQVPSLRDNKDNKDPNDPEVFDVDKSYIGLVAGSLAPLENLKHLVMESSTVVDGQFLSLLPKTIEHLEIVNCWELTADMMSDYLVTHGRNLRRLTLHHNQSLNLAFSPSLGPWCPELRELHMDLTYYSHHEHYKDSDPMYDSLLTISDIPAWPKTIEVIDLEQLAKWDAATAEMFFQSFVDQAPQIPKLRCLAVKAMLDVPWRQRSEFRDKWVGKLRKVFLRKPAKPRPYRSLSQWPSLRAEMTGQDAPRLETAEAEESTMDIPIRRSTRIASAPAPASTPANDKADHKRKRKRAVTLTRDLRKPKRPNISYRDPDTDEDLDLEGSEGSEGEVAPKDPSPLSTPPDSPSPPSEDEPFIHGLCDIVNIRFDNQKPREFQWRIEDFLDEDNHESEDDEWTSDREDDDSEVYAW